MLRESALNIWAGRKTRVHQTAGMTLAIFVMWRINERIKSIYIDKKHIEDSVAAIGFLTEGQEYACMGNLVKSRLVKYGIVLKNHYFLVSLA